MFDVPQAHSTPPVAQASPPATSGAIPAAPTSDLRPLASASFHLPSPIFYLLLAVCVFLYAPTRFFHEANPTWRLTSLLWTLEVIGITLLMLPFVLGAYHASRITHHARGFSAFCFSDFLFPIVFFLVAVPWPSGLENFLVQSLMRLNVATTIELLGLVGIPAVAHGNVIEISTGVVGIDEACSGIRSFQATLMISLFLGELYRLTVLRRIWLVVLGFVLAFAFNVGRTLLLAGIASAKGVGAVASWHDPAGVTILVACFLSLWALAVLLRRQRGEGKGDGAKVTVPSTFNSQPSTTPIPQLSTLRKLAFALTAWFLLVEAGTELWYRYHERTSAAAQRWSPNTENRGPDFTKIQIPSAIAGQFRADESRHARWQDAVGNSWQLYYFRWFPAYSLRQRISIQLAKTHGPEKCLPAVGMSLRSALGTITVPVVGMDLAMQQYVFNAEGRSLHVFYGIYEDPSGSAKLANRRKDCASRVAAALAGSRNYGQRYLELAVVGYERPEDARAAVTRELETLIKIEK